MRILTMAAERAPDRRNDADSKPAYVSLGDSMSIDDYAGGAGCGAASLLYRNRDADFPAWMGRDLRSCLRGQDGAIRGETSFVPLAMDGATSATVRYAQLPRLIERGVRPSVVTLTMGGNDLLQSFGRDDAASDALAALQTHGSAVLEGIRRQAWPEAPIVLGTIYDPSDGTGDTDTLGIVAWPAATDWIARYNEALRTLAAQFDVIVADIHAAFLGHGLATGVSPAQTEARPEERRLYYCGVVEPNAWGASAIRAAWWDAISSTGVLPDRNA